MANKIPLTPEELDYSKRMTKIYEERKKNPNLSPGILVEQFAEKIPNKWAIFFEDIKWTWQKLNQVSNQVANYFLKSGFKSGDTIAIMMENSLEILYVPIGINKIQGIVSYINIHQRKKALVHAFRISEPKWMMVDGDCLPFLLEIFDEINFDKNRVFVVNNSNLIDHNFINFEIEIERGLYENPLTTYNSNLFTISTNIFTSGTTGLPKAAPQNNVRLINPFTRVAMKLTQDDIIYCPLPLYHSHALVNGWGTSLQIGCTYSFRKRFSASYFWKDIKKHNATCFYYIGEIPRYLLNRPKSEYVENNAMKQMFGLGLRKEIWDIFKSRFKIERIHEFYGATDGAGGLYNIEGRSGMLGKITSPGVHAVVKINQDTSEFIKDENGFLLHCKPGETGMLLVAISENSNYLGYKDKNQTEKRIIRNAFENDIIYLNTGDLINLHEDNWVSFADRAGDTFRWKGENISTLEVENILNSIPEIEICNVYGVEIPKHEGRAGMVAIKLKKSGKFNPKTFADFIIENLPKYSIPIFVRIQNELEFTGTHKLRKINLRKESYDINIIKDTIYLWNPITQSYKNLGIDDYTNLLLGKMNI